MRLLLNILRWVTVTAGAIIIALLTLSVVLSNRVADIFLASLNRNISTRIEIGHYRLSLLRKFPRAALELRDVTIHSSKNLDRSQFGKVNTDTLLKAGSAFLEFGMRDIIRGNYNIASITISDAKLNLFSDSSGRVNYEITTKGTKPGNDNTVINLNRILISRMEVRYLNKATGIDVAGSVTSGRFRSRISGKDMELSCNSSFLIREFELFSSRAKVNAAGIIDLSLHQSDSNLVFKKGMLRLEDFRFGLTGLVTSSGRVDVRITGKNIQLAKLKKYLPGKYAEQFAEYSPEGVLKTECHITGPVSRKVNPLINLSFSIDNGSISNAGSKINIGELNLNGSFTNGDQKKPGSFDLTIEDYRFRIGTALWSGSLSITDFTRPKIRSVFTGEIIPGEILNFLTIPGITSADGSMRVNLSVDGTIEKKEKYTFADFLDLNPQADIRLYSLSVSGKNKNLSFNDADGDLMVAKNIWAEDLNFSWNGQRFGINGEFVSLPAWLAGRSVKIKAFGDISADNLNAAYFLPDSTKSESRGVKPVDLPDDIEADISFRVNNLHWDTFDAGQVTGHLFYQPGRLDLKSLSINALSGTASGNFSLVRNRTKGFLSWYSFDLKDIDINKTFGAFNNFGQNFIVAGNIAGSLSGNLSLLIPLDSLLNPIGQGVTAEGKYTIVNGALINFEPAKALSDYIEIKELGNITFSKLENELFIRDRFVAIPQMEINSSAADFTVSGKHGFDDSYEYHVKTYLSLLLSKKLKKENRKSDEFGAIEDDGLGRSSVFLKITGKDDRMKVSYDLKAAGNNVRQSLKKEKGNLKSILNEEYGWFRKDSTLKQDNTSKPKFRIIFPETDTTAAQKDTSGAGKDRRINRIFKKKFNPVPTN